MYELQRKLGLENALMVISEVRKPQSKAEEWGSDLADVMGSSRNTYSPECVMLLRPAGDRELGERLGLEDANGDAQTKDKSAERKEKLRLARSGLASKGMSLLKLVIAKGRDGYTKGGTELTFFYRQTRFEEGWPEQAVLAQASAPRNPKKAKRSGGRRTTKAPDRGRM